MDDIPLSFPSHYSRNQSPTAIHETHQRQKQIVMEDDRYNSTSASKNNNICDDHQNGLLKTDQQLRQQNFFSVVAPQQLSTTTSLKEQQHCRIIGGSEQQRQQQWSSSNSNSNGESRRTTSFSTRMRSSVNKLGENEDEINTTQKKHHKQQIFQRDRSPRTILKLERLKRSVADSDATAAMDKRHYHTSTTTKANFLSQSNKDLGTTTAPQIPSKARLRSMTAGAEVHCNHHSVSHRTYRVCCMRCLVASCGPQQQE
jgi:hypothetical protein